MPNKDFHAERIHGWFGQCGYCGKIVTAEIQYDCLTKRYAPFLLTFCGHVSHFESEPKPQFVYVADPGAY